MWHNSNLLRRWSIKDENNYLYSQAQTCVWLYSKLSNYNLFQILQLELHVIASETPNNLCEMIVIYYIARCV